MNELSTKETNNISWINIFQIWRFKDNDWGWLKKKKKKSELKQNWKQQRERINEIMKEKKRANGAMIVKSGARPSCLGYNKKKHFIREKRETKSADDEQLK